MLQRAVLRFCNQYMVLNIFQKAYKTFIIVACLFCTLFILSHIGSNNSLWATDKLSNENTNLKIIKEFQNVTSDSESISEYSQKLVYSVNELAKIFEPSSSFNNISFIIIIQIHDRIDFLKELIESLSSVYRISEALLVFSGDFYSPTIEKEIKSIKFSQTIRLLYPYSIQAYPDNFPGHSPNDCSDKNIFSGCKNYYWKDTYDHYRSPPLSQIKLHWLWKIRFALSEIKFIQNFNGPFLLLEEDYLVSEDLLATIEKIPGVKDTVQMISMGSYALNPNYNNMLYLSDKWISSSMNIGIIFNRATWSKIDECISEFFCHFDDYNWDWSLTHLLTFCIPTVKSLSLFNSPRVIHIGTCGTHFSNKICNAKLEAEAAKVKMSKFKDKLYPDAVKISHQNIFPKGSYRNNGGFKDPRDIALCDSILKNATDYRIISNIRNNII